MTGYTGEPPKWDPLPPWPTEPPEFDWAEVKRRHANRHKKPSAADRKRLGPIEIKLIGGPCNGEKLRVAKDTPDKLMLDRGRVEYRRRRGTNEWHCAGDDEVVSTSP